MGENRKNLLRRRSIVENLIEKPPFHYEKNQLLSSESGSISPEEIEKVINISLSKNRRDLQDNHSNKQGPPNQTCQTTINLYINDHHMMQENWEKYRRYPPRRKLRNEIVLGKSIPDHTLMKNLLGDLGVKKYPSAPNVTSKNLGNRRMLPSNRFPSEKSFTDSTGLFSKLETSYTGSTNYLDKGTRFLYVNEGRSGGDFRSSNIERINEEDEDGAGTKEEISDCPIHFRDHSVMKVTRDCEVTQDQYEQLDLIDPLKRFKRKPFMASQVSKNPAILYRDIAAAESSKEWKLEQPRRKMPTFQVRTQMVRDILNTNPQLIHSYHTGLMRNHKRLFDTLRQKDFQNITEDNPGFQSNELLPLVRTSGKIDQINEQQSKLVLCGKNRGPFCSVESHGSYEEYKKNLVKGPDGSLCCKNLDHGEDEIWSRAETRNFITSEFVKDKVKKFDKLFSKMLANSGGSRETHDDNKISNKKKNYRKGLFEIGNNFQQGTLSHDLLNGQNVSFPRETKNAMTNLMSKNSLMFLEKERMKRKVLGSSTELRNLPLQKRGSDESTTSWEDSIKSSGSNNRCWPGMAERVLRSTTEENTT